MLDGRAGTGAGAWATTACVAALLAVTGAGCAKQVPPAVLPQAALEVPVVPPRVVGPVMVEEPALPPEEPRTAPSARANHRNNTRGGTPARGTESPVVKVEPPDPNQKPSEATAEPGSASAPASEAGPLLRTPDTADDAEVAKRVRDTLGRAGQNLGRVDYTALNPGAKGQYDMARRFIAQAEEALKGKNLSFARYLAEKAETLSTSLLNR